MPIQQQGFSGIVPEVEQTFRSLRIVTKPWDHGAFGHYRVATTIALVATQAANGTLFSFRWGDSSRVCVIQRIRMTVLQTAAATATIFPSYQVFIARSFTASDSAGTAITLTGNNMKKRTNMGTTLVTDIRKSAVAAGLTVGTRTLDADPIIELSTQSAITTPVPNLYERESEQAVTDGVHPWVFAQNEGFIIRGPTTAFGAAGTANLQVGVSWAELATF